MSKCKTCSKEATLCKDCAINLARTEREGRRAKQGTATLYVGVDYDVKQAEPEVLAKAVTKLLEKVLAEPGALEEAGSPKLGHVFVLRDVP